MIECLFCGQYFAADFNLLDLLSTQKKRQGRLCWQCLKRFPRLGKTRCPNCDKNVEKSGLCLDCQDWQKIYPDNLLKNHAVYRYSDAFHDLMVNYKRYGDYCLREILQELIRKEIQGYHFDYYVPVPTSPEHQKRRQFDTVSAIFADLLPLSYFLKKKEGTGAQGEKNKRQRLLTPQGFFVAKDAPIKDNISNDRFLLLDDIYTTGRTLYNARDKLLEVFPQAKIESFAICH